VRIDAHQHFWRYSTGDYGWINDDMRAIRRDFLPPDLAPALAAARLDGTVAVQARQSLAETDWLLGLGDTSSLIKGVVGWVPLAQGGAGIGRLLDRYASHPRFKGVRHVLQAEPDAYFADSGFNLALDEVARRDLAYDLLILARQLPAALALVARHPSLRIVLDHIAKPVVQGTPSREWRAQLRDLARRPNVVCKFSGVVTEIPGWRWSVDIVRPYFDVVLEAFGPDRVMFGSDWPVCLVAADYADWLAAVEGFVGPLAPSERAAIMGDTATTVYRLIP
jgi:L-fuconolactonase